MQSVYYYAIHITKCIRKKKKISKEMNGDDGLAVIIPVNSSVIG